MESDTLISPLERIVVLEEANAQGMSGTCLKIFLAVARLVCTDKSKYDYGFAWGTHKQYAELANVNKNTISSNLKRLEEDGWLLVVRQDSRGHKVYKLGIGNVDKTADSRKKNPGNLY